MPKLNYRTTGSPPSSEERLRTSVYVDYENLYYSCINYGEHTRYSPNLESLINDLREHTLNFDIKVFGDFTKPGLKEEYDHVRTVTNEIIDCSNAESAVQKDCTDFIMLDHIYRNLINDYDQAVKQYILVTGDMHFSSVATYMRIQLNKIVGVYGVFGSTSKHLRDCASWDKMILIEDDSYAECQMNLISNFQYMDRTGKNPPTFNGAARHTAEFNNGDTERYMRALGEMVDDGFFDRREIEINSFPMRCLFPNWERINNELLPRLREVLAE